MVARLENVELVQFLENEVLAGRYASVEAGIEAAVARLKSEAADDEPLDDETLAAIDAADAAVARGEVRPWEDVRAELVLDFGLKL